MCFRNVCTPTSQRSATAVPATVYGCCVASGCRRRSLKASPMTAMNGDRLYLTVIVSLILNQIYILMLLSDLLPRLPDTNFLWLSTFVLRLL